MKPIVVVGSINMDLVSVTDRAPAPGETVFGSEFQMYSGGKGANQAVAVARLGYPINMLGKVGDDIFGVRLLEELVLNGVNTADIERVPGSSGTASIVVDGKGENSIIVTPAANLQVTPEYIESKRHVLQQAGMALVQLEVPLATVRRLAELCEELQVPLMLDPAPAQKLDAETLSRVTWLTPNQTEARFYVETSDGSEPPPESLFALGVRNVILKRGAKGVLVANRDGAICRVGAFPVKAVDTTAAGDSFNAAFAVSCLRGDSVEESARYAAAAAAISVGRKGAQASLPTRQEVDRFLADISG